MKKRHDPLTEWRGSNTPYWLDKLRPDVVARQMKQMDDLRKAAEAVAAMKEKKDAD